MNILQHRPRRHFTNENVRRSRAFRLEMTPSKARSDNVMYTVFHKIGTPLYFCNNFFKC